MKLLIPPEVFEDLETLIPVYRGAKNPAFHGSIDQGGIILSWDANGNVYLESDLLEEVEK